MAPEQAEGAEVSEQTDIYALGIVLYEMLSGSVPFKASTPSAVLVKQIQEAPLPLRKLRREIPASLDRLVAEAFLGCYLDRVVLSQLQRLQPRRHSLKVGVLRF